MVVSTASYRVYIYRYETSLYTINQTITYTISHVRRACLSDDENYIVINNKYQSSPNQYNTEIR